MKSESQGIIETLLGLPIFQAEWVLWLLIGISIASVAVMIERYVFYRRHAVDIDAIKRQFEHHLNAGDFKAASAYLSRFDSL